MHSIATFTFITYGACFALLIIGMTLTVRLFHSLGKDYPPYFKLIGKPIVFGFMTIPSMDDYTKRLKALSFIYSMVFKGTPRDFPQDVKLRKLAKAVQYIFSALVILFIVLVVLTYLYYKSDQ